MANFKYSTEASDDNIVSSLKENLLGNNFWIYKCLNLLLKMDDTIIAIDGNWGSGKTYIAKQMLAIINEKYDINYGSKETSEFDSFPQLQFKDLPIESCLAIYYNAWEYDNDNHPMASFLYYLLKMLNKRFKSNDFISAVSNFIKNIVEKLSDGWIKFSSGNVKNDLEDVLSSVLSSEYIREQISILLQELKSEKCNKIVIFIDELDRCRPSYALKVIELLNHYFKRDDILVVAMVDLEQLSNMIKNVYGTSTNAFLYLDKIFDLRFEVPNSSIDYEKYINCKISEPEFDSQFIFDKMCIEIIKEKKLTLRNIDRLLAYIEPFFKKLKRESYVYSGYIFIQCFFGIYYLTTKLFDIDSYNKIMKYNFDELLLFSNRDVVHEIIEKAYKDALKTNYDPNKLDEYIRNDLTEIINYLNGKDIYYVKLSFGNRSGYYYNWLKELNLMSLLNKKIEGDRK